MSSAAAVAVCKTASRALSFAVRAVSFARCGVSLLSFSLREKGEKKRAVHEGVFQRDTDRQTDRQRARGRETKRERVVGARACCAMSSA